MADAATHAPASPFYESTRSYRNAKSAVLLILVPAFAVLPIWATLFGVPHGHHAGGPYVFAMILSIAFIAGFIKLIYNVVNDVRETVRVDETGVLLPRGQSIPWNEITAIRFDRAPFSNRGYLACERTEEPGYFRSLRGHKPLAMDEATQLLQRIGTFLQTSHPRVKVYLSRKA